MTRTDIINILIDKYGYKSYLEIGVGQGENFKNIGIESKESCDPYNRGNADGHADFPITYPITSDEMFNEIPSDKKWDIIFIDGLHEGNQVMRDLFNGMRHLNDNGIILIHDSLPISEESASWPRQTNGTWHGSVYKIYPILKDLNINFFIIDTDEGIGVVPKQQISEMKSTIVPQESLLSFPEVMHNPNLRENLNIISEEIFMTFMKHF